MIQLILGSLRIQRERGEIPRVGDLEGAESGGGKACASCGYQVVCVVRHNIIYFGSPRR